MEKREDKEKIRVVHLSSAVEWRGGEQQMLYLYKGLDELAVEQWVWAPSGQVADRLRKENTNLKKLLFRQPWFLIDAISLLSFCKKNNINLLHAHDSRAHSLAWMATGVLGLKCPVIYHRRVDNPINTGFFTRKKYFSRRLEKIICVSANIKKIVDNQMPELAEKSVVIYSGVSSPKLEENTNQPLRKKLSIAADEILVGNISALDDHKDPQTFLAVAENMIRAGFKGSFIWVGGGERWRSELLERVQKSGLQNRIRFIGYLENAKNYLHELDVFLFTSSSEGLGTTVIDAMMRRVPVVATAGGGVPELISDKETGVLVSVGNVEALAAGIHWVLSHPLEKEKMVRAAFNKANKSFSVSKMVEGTLHLYLNLLIK